MKLWRRKKEICATFAVATQTAKVMATVRGKCLVKMEKVLSVYDKVFWEREKERPHTQSFYYIYYYNCSILLLIIVANLLLCLIYKLNFIIYMYP